MTNIETIKRQAEIEFQHELYREAVEKYKTKLRQKKSLWDRIFPFRIIILRKGKADV